MNEIEKEYKRVERICSKRTIEKQKWSHLRFPRDYSRKDRDKIRREVYNKIGRRVMWRDKNTVSLDLLFKKKE